MNEYQMADVCEPFGVFKGPVNYLCHLKSVQLVDTELLQVNLFLYPTAYYTTKEYSKCA